MPQLATPRASAPRTRSRQEILIGLTAGRLVLLPLLAWGVVHARGVAIAALATIVAADVADGVVARRMAAETTSRRIVDAGVDKVLIHGACLSVVLSDPSLWPLYLPLLALDTALVAGNIAILLSRRVFITGSSVHRTGSGSVALLGLMALCNAGLAVTLAAVLAWVVNYALATRYLRVLRRLPPPGDGGFRVLRTGSTT